MFGGSEGKLCARGDVRRGDRWMIRRDKRMQSWAINVLWLMDYWSLEV
jgi:hypothetical protein